MWLDLHLLESQAPLPAPGVKGEIALTHWALGWLPGPPSLEVIKICPDLARGWAGWHDSLSATVLLKLQLPAFCLRPAARVRHHLAVLLALRVWRIAG